MHVVGPAADAGRGTTGFVGIIPQHAEHLFTKDRALKIRPPLFRAEHKVQPNASQGLRHGIVLRPKTLCSSGFRAEGLAFSQPRATPWDLWPSPHSFSAQRANRLIRPFANRWSAGPNMYQHTTKYIILSTFPRALPWAERTRAPSGHNLENTLFGKFSFRKRIIIVFKLNRLRPS